MTDSLGRLAAALADRYTIEREIGQGGMATVYLAHDIKHDRGVAIKVLHPDLGAALGGERFLAEIRTTAKLQHPHILPLLDSGDADGLLYYVMPYVTGETLRARLARERQLPIADAVSIAREVADALGSAHALGIIHRDIKPENILLQGGHALVADFGIALAVQTAGGSRMTQTGLSLGTPQYMSPEQAMGEKSIDARSDIYALGAVTYEMLAGDPPFVGSSVQAIVAKVLTEKPSPISTVRDTVPTSMEAAVLTALAKLPADRFATAQQFAAALQGDNTGAMRHTTSVARPTAPLASRIGWIAAVVVSLVVAALGWLRPRAAPSDNTTRRFILTAPDKISVFGATGGITASDIALSRDGNAMVYYADGPLGLGLYVQRIGELVAHMLPGSGTGGDPAFSPNGQWIAYVGADNTIRKTPIDGTVATTICQVPGGLRGLTWLSNDEIVFARQALTTASGLWRVSANGGEPRQFGYETRSVERPIKLHPHASFDGKYVFYLADNGVITDDELAAISMSDEKVHHFKGSDGAVVLGLIDATLYYAKRNGTIQGAAFDPVSMALGSPVELADSVAVWTGLPAAALSASGTLLYTRGGVGKQLVRVDEHGIATPMFDFVSDAAHPRVSPDGRHIVFDVAGPGTRDIWIADIGARTMERLTRDGQNDRPEWSTDGLDVVYPAQVGRPTVHAQRADGSSPARTILDSVGNVREFVNSPDGKFIAYRVDSDSTGRDLYLKSTTPAAKSIPIAVTKANELMPRFSPDSKWLVYVSDESGSDEVYVRSPEAGGRVAISVGGGTEPLWAHDGRHILYRAGQYIISATLDFDPAPTPVRRDTLFQSPGVPDIFHPNFDILRDGKSYVFLRAVETNRRQVLVMNWIAEIRKRFQSAK